MNFKRFIALIFLLPSLSLAETQSVGGGFLGLNNSDSAFLIKDNEAQDLSNVDISENGYSVEKRDGYGTFSAVGVSTHPVLGGYYFVDVDGDKHIIHTNDTKIFHSEDGGAYAAFVTTDTRNSHYDFTDSQGYLWRANSSKDQILRYSGAAVTYYPNHPQGNQIEAMPDRLVISGTAANPNRVNFSGAADFTNFTVGPLETDPFTEDLGLPGQAINCMKYAFGELIVWTRTTMSKWVGSSQYDGRIEDISTTVGCDQPNSVVYDMGLVYWQAQDKHFYVYDGNVVTKLSSAISGSVSSFAGGESKNWDQTSEADFSAGTNTQTSALVSAGNVVLSTFSRTDTSTSDFTSGTADGTAAVSNSVYPSSAARTDSSTSEFSLGSFSGAFASNNRVYLSTSNSNLLNNGFESGSGTNADNWTETIGERTTALARSGSASMRSAGAPGCTVIPDASYYIQIFDANGNSLSLNYINSSPSASWTQRSLSLSSYTGQWIKLKINFNPSGSSPFDIMDVRTTDAFLSNGDVITWYDYCDSGIFYADDFSGGRSTTYSGTYTSASFDTAFTSAQWLASGANWATNSNSITVQTQSSSDNSNWQTAVAWSTGTAPSSDSRRYLRYVVTFSTGGTTSSTGLPYVDDVSLAAISNPAKFTSQVFNTTFSSAAWLSSGSNWTGNNYAIRFETQSSDDGSSWDTAVSWSTGSAPTSGWKKYIRYILFFSTSSSSNGNSLAHVDDVTLAARASSGTFISQTKNIGSNATSFGSFTADQTLNSGTIGYFIRTATTEGGLASASYTALTRNALITDSINPWIQIKATFTITAATQEPTLANFSVNWDEGTIIRSFGISDNDHRILWAVGEGTQTATSASYIYDPRFGTWLKYSFPFTAPARVGASIYFGSPTVGTVYSWPSGTSDNGSAITAYWKSKDFIGSDPFVEKDLLRYSVIAEAQTGSNLDVSYTINASSTITNNHSLTADVSGSSYRRINANLPSGKFGSFFNMKFGNDDADAPFRLLSFRFDYLPRPWRVLP